MKHRDRDSKTRTGASLRAGAAAAVLLLALTGAAAEVRGTCVRAELDETIALPDGSIYPPGTMRVCLTREYSPVAGLHEVSIGHSRAGLFLSRRFASEGAAADYPAVLVFRRGPAHLLFLGYAVRDRDRMLVYWLRPPVAAGTDLRTLLANDPERVLLVSAETR